MDKSEAVACVIIFFTTLFAVCAVMDKEPVPNSSSYEITTTVISTSNETKTTTSTKKTTTNTTSKKVKKKKTETVSTTTATTMSTQETMPETTIYETEPYVEAEYSWSDYTPYDLQTMGVVQWGGYRYTYYSELVLPGYGLNIEGRHVDGDGFVCDGDGYICVASGSLCWGTVVDTPFGKQGKVYDSGCDADVIDCYVHW